MLCIIPYIAITVDTTSSVAVDLDTVSGDYEPGMVILKCYWIAILAPVASIIGVLLCN